MPLLPASKISALPEEPVLRGELLSRDGLATRALELAEFYSAIELRSKRGVSLRRRFRSNTRFLSHAYFSFADAAKNKEVLTAGAEWLLDNYHVIEELIRELDKDLPGSYYKALPKLALNEWRGYPRVYQLMSEYVTHSDGAFDPDSLASFISAYQSKKVLKIGEIWAIPIMLRLVLAENLRRLAQVSLKVRFQRRASEQFAEKIFSVKNRAGSDLLVAFVAAAEQEPNMVRAGAALLQRRLRAVGSNGVLALQWLEQRLREEGIDPQDLAANERQAQAKDQISFGNAVTSLKNIASLNWREWFEAVSVVDHQLALDPALVYTSSDFATRDMYRHEVERLARRAKMDETTVAEKVIAFAATEGSNEWPDSRSRHIGYYLVGPGAPAFQKSIGVRPTGYEIISNFVHLYRLEWYLGSIILLTVCVLATLAKIIPPSQSSPIFTVLLIVLGVIPASEVSLQIIQWFVTRLVSPKPLPKLNFEKGIDAAWQTLVVVQTIISDQDQLATAVRSLKIRAVANPDKNLLYAIAVDLADSTSEVKSGDKGIVTRAGELYEQWLEEISPEDHAGLCILIRRRQWNPSEDKWMGWERKRGKVMELNQLILGSKTTSFDHQIGDIEKLANCKFVITLDSDTRLPPGSARKLSATLAHPLNRPVFDEAKKIVVQGYSLIQPRIGITLESGRSSVFASLFSGHSGLDPYTRVVSDLYQDAFSEGSFVGKGIYDVRAFEHAMSHRVPENALLSHDLFEGSFARCAVASDVELHDDFPQRYHAQMRREYRWIRGDWQLLPWLIPATNAAEKNTQMLSVSPLSWWKAIDNLRRSLYAPSLTLMIFLCVGWAPGNGLHWAGAFALMLFIPSVLTVFSSFSSLINDFLATITDVAPSYTVRDMLRVQFKGIYESIARTLLRFVFLAHQAVVSIDAISITLYRIYFSKKNLLEWETAMAAERRLGGDFFSFLRFMWNAVALTGIVALLWILSDRQYDGAAIPIILLWLLSPVVAYGISIQRFARSNKLADTDKEYLRSIAYETWKYFDTHLTAQYNYLIPDNLQVVPRRVVAPRTSPTNISLSTLSVVSAVDFGFITNIEAINVLEKIFTSLAKLDRFHGHFLNWYEITELKALAPRYVSTVDSGNLVGHFMALKQALVRFPQDAIWHHGHTDQLTWLSRMDSGSTIHGTSPFLKRVDSLSGLYELILETKSLNPTDVADQKLTQAMMRLKSSLTSLEPMLAWIGSLGVIEKLGERRGYHPKLRNITRLLRGRTPTLSLLNKIVTRLLKLEQLITVDDLQPTEVEAVKDLIAKLQIANVALTTTFKTLDTLSSEIERYIDEADFKFLFDTRKKLFVIGYNVDSGNKDNSFYDLLASEARLGSFVAIAKGDVEPAHWFRLARSFTKSSGGKSLLSWTGTMFEYLMPLLVMKDYPETILSGTYDAVVEAQIRYGASRGVPWGISESAYSGVDFEKTYQYRAFGVPGLGLKRGLGEDVVISPYSTALALMVAPSAAVKNLNVLEREGLLGEFGFYEAADYTRERLTSDERSHVIKSFLAHHQGMSLISINNVLNRGIMQKRFHHDIRVKAVELLLQEQFPELASVITPHRAELRSMKPLEHSASDNRTVVYRTPFLKEQKARVYSNGTLSLLAESTGSSRLTFAGDVIITRWRDDNGITPSGLFIFVKDLRTQKVWSTTYQPTRVMPDEYEVTFNPEKIIYRRRDRGTRLLTEVTVAPEDNVEIRKVSVTNLTRRLKQIELTSYGEVALAPWRADLAHQAFSKLFIASEFLSDADCLLFERKPRSEHEKPRYCFHMVVMPVVWARVQCETSRQKFIGRGRDISNSIAMENEGTLSGSIGTVLDPVMSLRARVEVEAGSSETIYFITGYADTREKCIEMVRRYQEAQAVTRAFELAWSHSDVELREQQFSIGRLNDYQQIACACFYNTPRLRLERGLYKDAKFPQNKLWRLGISGDEPLVLVTLGDNDQMKLVEEMLLAHDYLRRRGIRFDLVILNDSPGGYFQDLQGDLETIIRSSHARTLLDTTGGVFVRSLQFVSKEEHLLLQSLARVLLFGSKGSLSKQLAGKDQELPAFVEREIPSPHPYDTSPMLPTGLEFGTSYGGFSDDGKAYVMGIDTNQRPPQPWSNVIANEQFGFLVTESGGGYTWAFNSRENRLTPWSNDPVSDKPGEVLYIRDTSDGAFFSATPAPAPSGSRYIVTHRAGETSFETQAVGLKSTLVIHGDTKEAVKWYALNLENKERETKILDLFFYVEPVLGVSRDTTYRMIQTEYDLDTQSMIVEHPFNNDFSNTVVSVGSSLPMQGYTSVRGEFLGNGDIAQPQILARAETPQGNALQSILVASKPDPVVLSKKTGGGEDSAVVLHVQVSIAPQSAQRVQFFITAAQSREKSKFLTTRARSVLVAGDARTQVQAFWKNILTAVEVRTPSRSFDVLMNNWLLYQTLSCRIWGRTGLYQSSGAFGFRDQLQDSLALLYIDPSLTRKQILLHASRQFPEGDVQHWWHAPMGRGIRTKISDNYMWLPFAVAEYFSATNDTGILQEMISFIQAPLLAEGVNEAFGEVAITEEKATLYEHCKRAIRLSYTRISDRGLPLMGCGDWNDGMNEVGIGGKGESVWLAWFFSLTAKNFVAVADLFGDHEFASQLRDYGKALTTAADTHAWDGAWYRRAFFDDGSALGTAGDSECQIDSLAQSWSVMAGYSPLERQHQAFNSACDRLVDKESQIIKLLTPSFENHHPSPGYIQGYPPGIRENGGQYTHGSCWMILAAAKLGLGDKAHELFQVLNPIEHTRSDEWIHRYQTEPYVTCGDVYSNPQHNGRGGWSWYTGSSGWLYRGGLEGICGLTRVTDKLHINPVIPKTWELYEIKIKIEKATIKVTVKNPNQVTSGIVKFSVNGNEQGDHFLTLTDDILHTTGTLNVEIVMGS